MPMSIRAMCGGIRMPSKQGKSLLAKSAGLSRWLARQLDADQSVTGLPCMAIRMGVPASNRLQFGHHVVAFVEWVGNVLLCATFVERDA